MGWVPERVDHELSSTGKLVWAVAPGTIRVLGRIFYSMTVERVGNLPQPPFVVVANHYSHLDPPIVGAAIGQPIRYLALDGLFGVSRTFDQILEWTGAIPLSRTRVPLRAMKIALARLAAGENVGVFPEGTRVSHWGEHPPKRGAAWLAARTGLPLVPVAVIGTNRVFGVDNRLHWAPIKVVVGRPLSGSDTSDLMTGWSQWMGQQIERFPNLA